MLIYELVRMKVKEEQAAIRLMCVVPRHHLEHIRAIADERAELFRKLWIETDAQQPKYMTPQCAGLESVYDDVVKGRLS